jgi:hypothetical protein
MFRSLTFSRRKMSWREFKRGARCRLGTLPITSAGGHRRKSLSGKSAQGIHCFSRVPEIPPTEAKQGFNMTRSPDSRVPKLLSTPQRISILGLGQSSCIESGMNSNHYQPARQDSGEEPVAAKKSRGPVDGFSQPSRERQETEDTLGSGYTCETSDSQDLPPPARPSLITPRFSSLPRLSTGNQRALHPRQAIR